MRIIDTNYFFSGDFQGQGVRIMHQCALCNPKYGTRTPRLCIHTPKLSSHNTVLIGNTILIRCFRSTSIKLLVDKIK